MKKQKIYGLAIIVGSVLVLGAFLVEAASPGRLNNWSYLAMIGAAISLVGGVIVFAKSNDS